MKKHAAIFWERLAELDASDYKPYLPSQNELRRPPTVEINNTCNINCLMCNTLMAKRQKGVIKDDLLIQVLQELKAEGVEAVDVHTIGDPLANPRLPQILAVFREVGMILVLSTNGLLLERHLDTLLEYRDISSHIRFSIDGATKETYELIRAGGKWNDLLHNIQLAKEELLPRGYSISSNMVLSNDNVHEVGQFIQLFRQFIDPRWMSFGFMNSLSPDTSYFHRVNLFPEATFPNRPCQLPFRSLWVHHDGAVSSCCRDYHGELIVGDIKNQSIRDVWNGHVLEKLREAHRKGEVKDYRLCDNCFIVDDRIVALFNALMEYLVRKEPYGPAEYYQEKVDRFTEIIQSGGPFEPKFSQPMFVKEILSIR
ncbi:MAG: radical SAM protein [Arenicellales bacterium]|nr:radical SAM protein [Arenicellales bacterium]MDP7618307.1 radical SAM protein [Arenicellales bacterium]